MLVIGFFAAAFVLSTFVIRRGIPKLASDKPGDGPKPDGEGAKRLPDSATDRVFDFRATGFWIGFCETLLIFVLVYAGEFSALAIIIGAKEFVRKEKISADPSYYLLGTLANLSIAVLFALASQWLVAATPCP